MRKQQNNGSHRNKADKTDNILKQQKEAEMTWGNKGNIFPKANRFPSSSSQEKKEVNRAHSQIRDENMNLSSSLPWNTNNNNNQGSQQTGEFKTNRNLPNLIPSYVNQHSKEREYQTMMAM